MKTYNHNRRSFIKMTSMGATGLALSRPWETVARPTRRLSGSEYIKLGVASYSLRTLNQAEAIAAMKALGISYISIKSFHLPLDATPDELTAGRRAFEEAGIQIVSGGVIYLQQDDDNDIRKHFEYAKHCGMPLMVIGSTPAILPRIEPFVKEYDIKVAIHNHGPEDQTFPGPKDILPLIENMDPRVGLCIDVGHTARTGVDVVEAIADAGDRVLDVHIKDLRDLMGRGSDCIVGEGAMPVAAIFRQLDKMKYDGFVNLEYEIDANGPVPGMKLSFAYMKGVIAGMAGS